MASNRRKFYDLKSERFYNENISTNTSEEQVKVEESIEHLFTLFEQLSSINPDQPHLLRNKHVSFLKRSLSCLSSGYECLDASRPWLCYWILHALELLNETLEDEDISKIARFLGKCQNPDGGFGGGPQQYSHLATTYAAINALCILGTEEAYNIINRQKLLEFLWSVRVPNGAFQIHKDGEVDIRGVYCAVSVAKLTNIYTEELFANSAEWIVGCQTYEGGFSGSPGMEAHGGYAFCGFAALALLKKEHLCDVNALIRWLVNRQMKFEGGFQGRTNKLVDGCYSFWQGGTFPILHRLLDSDLVNEDGRWLFHQEALQEYILICCQNTSGGLIDKPTKPRDIYHTCYTLSGLSVAQHSAKNNLIIIGDSDNELAPLHPFYNISLQSTLNTLSYFQKFPVPQVKLK